MNFTDALREAMPRQQIPEFLSDLQRLVQALREDQPWQEHLSPLLRSQPLLIMMYLQPGPKRDEVRAALRDHPTARE